MVAMELGARLEGMTDLQVRHCSRGTNTIQRYCTVLYCNIIAGHHVTSNRASL